MVVVWVCSNFFAIFCLAVFNFGVIRAWIVVKIYLLNLQSLSHACNASWHISRSIYIKELPLCALLFSSIFCFPVFATCKSFGHWLWWKQKGKGEGFEKVKKILLFMWVSLVIFKVWFCLNFGLREWTQKKKWREIFWVWTQKNHCLRLRKKWTLMGTEK